jgi:hypothetical protein
MTEPFASKDTEHSDLELILAFEGEGPCRPLETGNPRIASIMCTKRKDREAASRGRPLGRWWKGKVA